MVTTEPAASTSLHSSRSGPPIEVRDVSRSFEQVEALREVSLTVGAGEIHALLGPNGAGKTTLLRILCGLVDADLGGISFLGQSSQKLTTRDWHRLFGLVPSGDRSFYLRLSGLENLIFFARMQGLRRRAAEERARERLAQVDLTDAAERMVGTYSHGMQKRLSVARALLMDPPLLLVDEATHDLDPEAARSVREMVSSCARRGAAVIWATQRVEEIRGFADRVTLLHQGRAKFQGSVDELLALSGASRYVLQLQDIGAGTADPLATRVANAVARIGRIVPTDPGREEHWLLSLDQGVTLGDAVVALANAGALVLKCRGESSEVEAAFLHLVSTA